MRSAKITRGRTVQAEVTKGHRRSAEVGAGTVVLICMNYFTDPDPGSRYSPVASSMVLFMLFYIYAYTRRRQKS